jgi:hypothetical protein
MRHTDILDRPSTSWPAPRASMGGSDVDGGFRN